METQVVVAGGGVGGLAVALAFARQNIAVIVVERRLQPGAVDRGDILHNGSMHYLQKWGLDSDIEAAKPLRFSDFKIFDNQGGVLFEFDVRRELGPGRFFTSLRHPTIETVLEKGTKRYGPLIQVVRGSKVAGILSHKGRTIGVRTDKGEVKAKLTVFATGSGSHLANTLFPDRISHDYGTSFYNIRFQRKPVEREHAFYVIGKGGVVVGVPLPENQIRLGIQFHRHDTASSPINSENFVEKMRDIFPVFPLSEVRMIDCHLYKLKRHLRLAMWRPGAVVIGDAAHTVHPTGGQGMNLALQDADRLAQTVAGSIGNPRHLDQACEKYAKLRRRELRPVILRTHLLGIAASWEAPALVGMRQLFVAGMKHTGPLKKYLFRQISDVA